jgi:hypothetical protein
VSENGRRVSRHCPHTQDNSCFVVELTKDTGGLCETTAREARDYDSVCDPTHLALNPHPIIRSDRRTFIQGGQYPAIQPNLVPGQSNGVSANAEKAKRLVARLARDFPREHEPCPVGSDRALDAAFITAPEARDPELLKKLDAVAGRVLRG